VTLYSAPNSVQEFDNAGAVMSVDDSLEYTFQVVISSSTCITIKVCLALLMIKNVRTPQNLDS